MHNLSPQWISQTHCFSPTSSKYIPHRDSRAKVTTTRQNRCSMMFSMPQQHEAEYSMVLLQSVLHRGALDGSRRTSFGFWLNLRSEFVVDHPVIPDNNPACVSEAWALTEALSHRRAKAIKGAKLRRRTRTTLAAPGRRYRRRVRTREVVVLLDFVVEPCTRL